MTSKPSIADYKLPAQFTGDKKPTSKVGAPSSFLITINSNKSQKFSTNAKWVAVGRRLIYLAKLTEWHFSNGDFVKPKDANEQMQLLDMQYGLEKSQKKTEAHIHIIVRFSGKCQLDGPAFKKMIYDNAAPDIETKPYVNIKHFKDIRAIMERYISKGSSMQMTLNKHIDEALSGPSTTTTTAATSHHSQPVGQVSEA